MFREHADDSSEAIPHLHRTALLALLVAPTLVSPWIVGRIHELQTLDELLVELDRPSHDIVLCVKRSYGYSSRTCSTTRR